MNWDKLPTRDRASLARHLRHLSDELAPLPSDQAPPSQAVHHSLEGPLYDRVSFGEQEQLVRALREKPANVSLDDLLRALAGKDRTGS